MIGLGVWHTSPGILEIYGFNGFVIGRLDVITLFVGK
jgi:hypothetical protein